MFKDYETDNNGFEKCNLLKKKNTFIFKNWRKVNDDENYYENWAADKEGNNKADLLIVNNEEKYYNWTSDKYKN